MSFPLALPRVLIGLVWFGAVPAALAGTPEDLGRLLRLDDVMAVMREEGLAYGTELEAELFPGVGGARWQGMVDAIYDAGAMRRDFDAVFGPQMAADPGAMAETILFLDSDRGQRIVGLEIEARRALLDQAVEDAARVRLDAMRRDGDARLDLIERFAEVNDLIEQNVSGALNANLGFYRGLASGGLFEEAMTESDMLAEVWSQEPQVRADTRDWLFPFLALAYQPLSDADLEAYIDFSETAGGQALNAAMFAGFDRVFSAISEDLGAAAAQVMSGEDI
jgi:hypothetical protein